MLYYVMLQGAGASSSEEVGRGDDTVGNPLRARIYRFELVELVLFLKLDEQLRVEPLEATVSQSTVPSPPLRRGLREPGSAEHRSGLRPR